MKDFSMISRFDAVQVMLHIIDDLMSLILSMSHNLLRLRPLILIDHDDHRPINP